MSASPTATNTTPNNTTEEPATETTDPLQDKFRAINQIVVRHRMMERALNLIEECRVQSVGSREPDCLLIYGPSGVGKTTVKDHYYRQNPERRTGEGRIIPVLTAIIPSKASVKSMATAMLDALGANMPARGNQTYQTIRLYKMIKEVQVEVIILDEFQHFIEPGKERVIEEVAEWLKNLISVAKVPVVLMGLPQSRQVLEVNEQLRRRFSSQLCLGPYETSRLRIGFLTGFLKCLEESLPFKKVSDLSRPDWVSRFNWASKGVVAHVMKIVKGAAYDAARQGKERITLEMLEHSYANRILQPEVHINENKRKKLPPPINPFKKDWAAPAPRQRFTQPASEAIKVKDKPKGSGGSGSPKKKPARKTKKQANREVSQILNP